MSNIRKFKKHVPVDVNTELINKQEDSIDDDFAQLNKKPSNDYFSSNSGLTGFEDELRDFCSVENVDQLNISTFVDELGVELYKGVTAGRLSNWFRRKNIETREKTLNSLLSLVESAKRSAESLQDFKARLLRERHIIALEIKKVIEEHYLAIKRQQDDYSHGKFMQSAERKKVLHDLERVQIENEILKQKIREDMYKADALKWHAEDARNKSMITELRGKLISKIIDEMKFADINMKQVFVLIEMIKDSTTGNDIFGAEAKWEQMKAEAKRAMAQAEQEQTRAEFERFKFEDEKIKPNV
ncbi:MAG: hypothetical protein WC799_18120 [Desulfobacteraceae bacterium]|jgi:arginine/lysine/ornithine decarboxylase